MDSLKPAARRGILLKHPEAFLKEIHLDVISLYLRPFIVFMAFILSSHLSQTER